MRRLTPGHSGLRGRWSVASLAIGLLIAALAVPVTRVVAADPVTFETPTGTAVLGKPLVLETDFRAPVAPLRVELLSHLPTEKSVSVEAADVAPSGGGYHASVTEQGHVLPNTTFDFRFRVTLPDGSVSLGPEATLTVTDDRFTWKTLEGDVVRLHWYNGDDAFARRAVQIGDDAIHGAEDLLGVKETQKVDFFIYDDETKFRDALGPGTRENVGGQAVAAIRTLFGLIGPTEINSSWVDILVTHELTHLVFNTAVDNPYHLPPRWLNEGLAVYRSEGYGGRDKGIVANAVTDRTIIPLDGLGGLFPTGDGFGQAYAEAVSAVDYLVRTYGQDNLVKLIRSYASGVTDNEAFTAAYGKTVAQISDDWLASVGASAPEPYGPKPDPAGPVPPDWTTAHAGTFAWLGTWLPLLR
jgi:hypothetical protein